MIENFLEDFVGEKKLVYIRWETVVPDFFVRWRRIELSNQNQSQHCFTSSINAFFLEFFRTSRWKIESLATNTWFLWFTNFADSLLWYQKFWTEKKYPSWLRKNITVVLHHFCRVVPDNKGKLNRKQFYTISSSCSKLLFDLLQCVLVI